MELEFVNRRVDLKTLFEEIKRGFVAAKGFKILKEECGESYFFLAFNCYSVPGVVKIIIEGSSERFSVKFYLKENRLLSLISYVGIPFGTGYIYLRTVKKMENFQKLEREFYAFLSRVVAFLDGSADDCV